MQQLNGVKVSFRLLLARALMFWYYTIRFRAADVMLQATKENTEVNGQREKFLQRNFKFQHDFCQLFGPYHSFCQTCQKTNWESCCLKACNATEPFPLDEVDCLVYGLSPECVSRINKMTWAAIFRHIGREILILMRKSGAKSGYKERFSCPELIESGCRLPWGERPGGCVLYLCGPFAYFMNWPDYWRYVWLSVKYLACLTIYIRGLAV